MTALELSQVFGSEATQSSIALVVSKSDLAKVGLTPSTNNSAESLFAAILLLFASSFKGEVTSEASDRPPRCDRYLTYDAGITDPILNPFYWRRIFAKPNGLPIIRDLFILEARYPAQEIKLSLDVADF